MLGSTRWRRQSEQLADCAIRFSNRIPVIARTRKIRIRKRNPPMRRTTQHIPRRRLTIHSKEKSRLRIHVGVSPAIEDDSRDVPPRIESAGREHVGHLLAKRFLVLSERRAEQLRASLSALLSYS